MKVNKKGEELKGKVKELKKKKVRQFEGHELKKEEEAEK